MAKLAVYLTYAYHTRDKSYSFENCGNNLVTERQSAIRLFTAEINFIVVKLVEIHLERKMV